eukprot:365823-Chlamydomonas_euryale.AAC.12
MVKWLRPCDANALNAEPGSAGLAALASTRRGGPADLSRLRGGVAAAAAARLPAKAPIVPAEGPANSAPLRSVSQRRGVTCAFVGVDIAAASAARRRKRERSARCELRGLARGAAASVCRGSARLKQWVFTKQAASPSEEGRDVASGAGQSCAATKSLTGMRQGCCQRSERWRDAREDAPGALQHFRQHEPERETPGRFKRPGGWSPHEGWMSRRHTRPAARPRSGPRATHAVRASFVSASRSPRRRRGPRLRRLRRVAHPGTSSPFLDIGA